MKRYRRDSLRILGSVGEPINPEVWRWYHDVVGDGRCAVVDTWWQTETGGILITPLPGATPCKPGSATLPFFGIRPGARGRAGARCSRATASSGDLCLRRHLAGAGAHGLRRPPAVPRDLLLPVSRAYYFTGDGCRRDEDGYYWITGRVDDVLNVSGHRLGTAEIESALVAHEAVAEAAVVGFPHDDQGHGHLRLRAPDAGLRDLGPRGAGRQRSRSRCATSSAPIATPDRIQIVSGLPKTRSGKIMRRILRKIAAGEYEELGDITTLAEPAVVEKLVDDHRSQHV